MRSPRDRSSDIHLIDICIIYRTLFEFILSNGSFCFVCFFSWPSFIAPMGDIMRMNGEREERHVQH